MWGWESVTTTMDSTTPSDVQLAQSLRRHGAPCEAASRSAPRSMCCPSVGAFAHAQSMSAYMRLVPCTLPAQTSPLVPVCALPCAQAPSRRPLWWFLGGREEVTVVMSRQNQLEVVCYRTLQAPVTPVICFPLRMSQSVCFCLLGRAFCRWWFRDRNACSC